jgi:hypothetical protein
MMIGYMLESVCGLLFALGHAFQTTLSRRPFSKNHKKLLATGYKAFFDCAAFFTASIQISCVVVLVRRDFGINANGLGGTETQITWAIALLCMLPLTYSLVILNHINKKKSGYRLFLFYVCWVFYFYTFISTMIGEFAPSQIGAGAGNNGITIITTEEWDQLTDLCLSGVPALSSIEQTVLRAFSATGSLLVATYGLGQLLWFIAERQWPNQTKKLRTKGYAILPERELTPCLITVWIVLLTIVTIPLFWGIFKLRGYQEALANASSNAYVDNQWTFGQVVAIMIFTPVFTKMGYLMVQERSFGSIGNQKRP